MDAVGRVADQGDPRRGQILGQLQRQRIDEARPHHRDIVEEIPEPPHQMGVEGLVRRRFQRLGASRGLGPDEAGPPLGQRQDGERTGRQKVFVGDIAVVAAKRHRGHDAALPIAPADRVDAGLAPHPRSPALGPDHQRGAQHVTVRQRDRGQARPRLDPVHRGRGADLQTRRRHRLGEGDADAPVLDHIAQRLAVGAVADLVGVEAQEGGRGGPRGRPGPAPVGDQNAVHAAGVRTQALAHAERVQHAESRECDRRRTPVERRRQLGRKRLRIDQHHPQPALGGGETEGRARQPGPGDDDVVAVGFGHEPVVAPQGREVQCGKVEAGVRPLK